MFSNVMYMQKGYIDTSRVKEMENQCFIKDDFSDELLGKIWRNYNFDKAEEKLFELQCELSKATFLKNEPKMKYFQNKIIFSTEAKMLAVRQVSEISKSKARNR